MRPEWRQTSTSSFLLLQFFVYDQSVSSVLWSRHNHLEEETFHKARVFDLRKHSAEIDRLRRRVELLESQVARQLTSMMDIVNLVLCFQQLQVEQDARKNEISHLEKVIGLTVEEARKVEYVQESQVSV